LILHLLRRIPSLVHVLARSLWLLRNVLHHTPNLSPGEAVVFTDTSPNDCLSFLNKDILSTSQERHE
jgi:hypothetical protein